MRESLDLDETSVILHEYVHFLTRNYTGQSFARWFDEGFAEYLSSTAIIRDGFQIGLPNENRLKSLQYRNWISPRKLIVPDEYEKLNRDDKGMYYAQAWILVHFLMNRDDRESRFADDMLHFVKLTVDGSEELAAFETAFGIPPEYLWRNVGSYLTKTCCTAFVLKIEELQPDFEPTIRKITRTEISLNLGQIAARFRKYDEAEKWYEIALRDEATRPWAEAGLGDLLKFTGDYGAARPHFETAVALKPDDPHIQLDAAEFWLTMATNSRFPSEQEDYLKRARMNFVAAWKLDDTMPETYAMYGRSYLMEGSNVEKAVEMFEQAALLHPSSVQIRAMLTEAYAAVGRNDDAIGQARLILAWGHEDSEPARVARSTIARLTRDDADEIVSADGANR